MRLQPAAIAATVNALLVVTLLSLVLFPGPLDTEALLVLSFVGLAAVITAWRTFVHARAMGPWSGWRGVFEAGLVGFAGTLVVLAHGIVTRPAEAPAYVIFYGSVFFLVGCALGLMLWASARLVLLLTAITQRRVGGLRGPLV